MYVNADVVQLYL